MIYNESFNYSSAGVGSAMAVVLFLLSIVLTVVMLWVLVRSGRLRVATGV